MVPCPVITHDRLVRAISMSRAFDYLNVGFGHHNAFKGMSVFTYFYVTPWGFAEYE